MSTSFDNPAPSVADSTGTCFRVGGLSLACTGRSLLEVLEVPDISPVGGTQPWFLGLASYRAELLPVTDLAQWAGMAVSSDAPEQPDSIDKAENRSRLLVIGRSPAGNKTVTSMTGEKIALRVANVSGQVVLDDASAIETDTTLMEARLRDCLDAYEDSTDAKRGRATAAADRNVTIERLMGVFEGYWSNGETVFVANLEKLFSMDAFLQVSTLQHGAAQSVSNRSGSGASSMRAELA